MKYYVCRFCCKPFKSLLSMDKTKHCIGTLSKISELEYNRLKAIEDKNVKPDTG